MKKIFNKYLLLLLSFCGLIISLEVFLPRKVSAASNNASDDNINLGEVCTCTSYCNCESKAGLSKIACYASCSLCQANCAIINAQQATKTPAPSGNPPQPKPVTPKPTPKPTPTPVPCKLNGFNFSSQHVSTGSQVIASLSTTGDCSKSKVTVSCSNCGVTSASTSVVLVNAGSNTCSNGSLQVTLSPGGTASGTFYVAGSWVRWTNRVYDEPLPGTGFFADLKGADTYAASIPVYKDGKYYYASGYGRGCSETYGGTVIYNEPTVVVPDPSPNPGCYANTKDIKTATIAKWQNSASLDASNLLKDVSEVRCIPLGGVSFCSPESIVPSKQKEKADVCENSSNPAIQFTDGESCVGTSFYSIDCNNKVTIKYDNGDDKSNDNIIKTTNNLLPGQGFEFGITAEIGKKCTGTFNTSNWQSVYDKIANQIKTVANKKKIAKSEKDKKYIESLYNQLLTDEEKIIDYANKYNNQKASLNIDLNSNISLKYETETGEKTISSGFIQSVLDEGKISSKTTKTAKLKLRNNKTLTVKEEYEWNNYNKPKIVKLILPKSYIDSTTGSITNETTGIDGGNKLYIESNAKGDKTGKKANMNIKVTGKIGNNEVLTSENKQCQIAVYTVDFKYRPIELTNPFISDSYAKGENWSNKHYNFTKIINSKLWERNGSLYNISLNASEIAALKKSNENNRSSSPYLGLCNKIKRESQDGITKKICDKLN